MLLYPNAKVNIGLDIIRKRSDGFHDIETIFYPLSLSDVLEIVPSKKFSFRQTGLEIDGDTENNIVVKAFRLLQKQFNLPNISIHLHKIIPFGAGLGGGSSDAAFTLVGLNQLFNLTISKTELMDLAVKLGSDCPFFILNKPVLAQGKGELFTSILFSLKGYHLVLIKPNVEVSTAMAYSNVIPLVPKQKLKHRINMPILEWKKSIENGFEKCVNLAAPEVDKIKEKLYEMGATYASMSGSGSSVFGLFPSVPEDILIHFQDCFCRVEECKF